MVGSSKDKALTKAEREKLEKELKDSKHIMILFLGVYAGLRVSEMIQCRLSWLEWHYIKDKKVLAINIPSEDRDARNKLKKWNPKNGTNRTTFVFEDSQAAAIYFWFDNNEDGLQLSRQAITTYIVQKKFAKIIRRSDKDICTHALRSTFQNYLFYEKNFDMKFCQLVLGHKDESTTTRFYTTHDKISALSYLENKEW